MLGQRRCRLGGSLDSGIEVEADEKRWSAVISSVAMLRDTWRRAVWEDGKTRQCETGQAKTYRSHVGKCQWWRSSEQSQAGNSDGVERESARE